MGDIKYSKAIFSAAAKIFISAQLLCVSTVLFLAFSVAFSGTCSVAQGSVLSDDVKGNINGNPLLANQHFVFEVSATASFTSPASGKTYRTLRLLLDPKKQAAPVKEYLKDQFGDVTESFEPEKLYNFRTIRSQMNIPNKTGNCFDWARHFMFPFVDSMTNLVGTAPSDTFHTTLDWFKDAGKNETGLLSATQVDEAAAVKRLTAMVMKEQTNQDGIREGLQAGDVILYGYGPSTNDNYHIFTFLGLDTDGNEIVFTKNGSSNSPPSFMYWEDLYQYYVKVYHDPPLVTVLRFAVLP